MTSTFSAKQLEVGFAGISKLFELGQSPLVDKISSIVEAHGGSEAINAAAQKNSAVSNLLSTIERARPDHFEKVNELADLRDSGRFVKMDDYVQAALEGHPAPEQADSVNAVTLEISWLQVLPCLWAQVDQAIANRELLPGRYILGKDMKESEENGGLAATVAALKILGVSFVDVLDTNGAASRANVHLGGPETLAGYFGGIGQPNNHPIQWIEEYLHYYMNFGVSEVLNINYGTVLAGYILHNLGVDIRFKLSVFLGNDNPYAVSMNLMLARLFAREDGSTPLIGINFANSIDNEHIAICSGIRKQLGFERQVRFEHHILQDRIGMVRQPFDRRTELIELAKMVPNISAKHEGGEVATEDTREHPSTVFDLFLTEKQIVDDGHLDRVVRSYLDKHDAINNTARALIRNGVSVRAAPNAHN